MRGFDMCICWARGSCALAVLWAVVLPLSGQAAETGALERSFSYGTPWGASSRSNLGNSPMTPPPSYQIGGYRLETPSDPQERQRPETSTPGLPAWAQDAYRPDVLRDLEPFGANLFQGNFASTYSSGLNGDYVILPGDRITVRVWGARSYDDVLFVDQQGNIFLPEIGPVRVAGLKQTALPGAVKAKLASIFTGNVNIYVNLQSTQPVAVYVAGGVPHPGRYAGGPVDSAMSYLDRAGGILPEQGGYRNIRVLRNGKTLGRIDLYSFMLDGHLPDLRLKDGDTILVGPCGPSVAAYGLLRRPARYEFTDVPTGRDLLEYASPLNGVSHVSVSGVRQSAPFHVYVPLAEFEAFRLADGDRVEFVADARGRTIMVAVSGAIRGASRFPVLKDTRLKTLLEYVSVESNLADTGAVYLRRKSVAEEQKAILADSLRRLEQSALTATSSSVDEANIRVREAELIQNFVQRASQLKPDGVVVVSRAGKVADILLEDGDEIIIPQKTDVIHISGEVLIPKAVTWEKGRTLDAYLASAGGLSDRADRRNILIVGQNGEVTRADARNVQPGDRILIMPKFDSKNVQLVKDFAQVLYQIAVAVKVAVGL